MKRASLVLALLIAGACGTNEGPPDARVIDAPPPGGTVSLTWSMHEGASALTCDQISASIVSVTILPENAGFGFVDTFSCTSGKGTSRALAPGKYTITVELDGGTGALAPSQQLTHIDVTSGQDTALGAIDFQVVAKGGVSIKLAAKSKAENCTATGADIASMTLQMQDGAGTCIPTTFMIAAGAKNPASTYTSDCNTTPTGPCIEQDQTVTATGLRSGSVKLVVTGDVGGKACWNGLLPLTVPAMNATKDYGTGLLIHDDTLCP
jgi:hypothetical protein